MAFIIGNEEKEARLLTSCGWRPRNCIEIARAGDNNALTIVSTESGEGATVTKAELSAFIRKVKAGKFDEFA